MLVFYMATCLATKTILLILSTSQLVLMSGVSSLTRMKYAHKEFFMFRFTDQEPAQ
jgi:hypothetical protein